jgi:hypothetical protein
VHQARCRGDQENGKGIWASTGDKFASDEIYQCVQKEFNAVHAYDFAFYEEINHLAQEEPNDALDHETLGIHASIAQWRRKCGLSSEAVVQLGVAESTVGIGRINLLNNFAADCIPEIQTKRNPVLPLVVAADVIKSCEGRVAI